MARRVSHQRRRQHLPVHRGESEVGEKPGLPGTLGVIKRQEVISDFAVFDESLACVREVHCFLRRSSLTSKRDAK